MIVRYVLSFLEDSDLSEKIQAAALDFLVCMLETQVSSKEKEKEKKKEERSLNFYIKID